MRVLNPDPDPTINSNPDLRTNSESGADNDLDLIKNVGSGFGIISHTDLATNSEY